VGGSGGCRCRNSGGKSSIRIGNALAESEEDELCWAARRDDMRSRFSGVKDCQNGGGAGYPAAREGCCCCCSSMIDGWTVGGLAVESYHEADMARGRRVRVRIAVVAVVWDVYGEKSAKHSC
jgi:hypothetical protein